MNDFVLKNIGKVSSAVFHPDASKKRVFVTTDAGALAALDVKSGEVVWRQMPSAHARVVRLFGNQVATLSGGRGHLSVWDAQSGALIWDRMVLDSAAGDEAGEAGVDAAFLIDQDGDSIDDVAVLCNNEVVLFSGDDGSQLWRVQVAKSDVRLSTLHSDGQGVITVIGASLTGNNAQISRLSSKDGSLLKSSGLVSKPSGAARNFCEMHVLVAGGCLACVGSSFLSLFDLATGASSVIDVNELSGLSDKASAVRLQQTGSYSSVAVIFPAPLQSTDEQSSDDETSGHALVMEIRKGDRGGSESWGAEKRHVVSFGKNDALAAGQDKNGQEVWVHARTSEIQGNGLGVPEALLLVDTLSSSAVAKKTSHQVNGYSRRANGEVETIYANPYVRKDGTIGYRALVVTKTHTASMLQQDDVVWENHGALAETVAASFVDIPVLPPLHDEMFQSGISNPLVALFKRFAADISDLVQLPMFLIKMLNPKGKDYKKMPWDSEGVSLKHDMEGDRFGFKKLAVVVTKPGVVFGLHSQTGAIVWKVNLADSLSPNVEALKLFMTRPTSSPGGFGNLEAVVVGKNVDTGMGMNFWINPLTGLCTGRHAMTKKIVHASLLPLVAGDHTKLLMLVMDDLEVRVVPDLIPAHQLLGKPF